MLGRRRALLERLASLALILLVCGLGASVYLALKPLSRAPHRDKGPMTDTDTTAVGPSALSDEQLQDVWRGRDPLVSESERPPAQNPLQMAPGPADALPFKLRGVLYFSSGEDSIAYIESGGKVHLYKIDSTVEGWLISGIDANAVTLTRDGVQRTLSIQGRAYASRPIDQMTPRTPARTSPGKHSSISGKGAAPPAGKKGPLYSRAKGAASGRSSRPERRLPPPLQGADARQAVPRAVAEKVRTNPTGLDFGVDYSQGLDKDGKIRGFAVDKVKPGSLAAQYGLAPGDRILAVNGQPIDSLARAMQLYRRFRNSDSVRVRIKRGGQIKEVLYYAR